MNPRILANVVVIDMAAANYAVQSCSRSTAASPGRAPLIAAACGSEVEFFGARQPPPAQGQHTRELLAEFGYTAAEFEAFLRAGSAFTAEGG
jgi:crotonobetainyl-CoA:carnitine CoA-transferase CaiB-like acyl-CoA transferase